MTDPLQTDETPPVLAKTRAGEVVVLPLNEILEGVAGGSTLVEMCKTLGVKRGVVIKRLASTPELQRQYEIATIMRATVFADEIVSIADEDCSSDVIDPNGKVIGRATDHAKVRQNALRVDARKWVAAHLLPKYSGNDEKRELADALSTLIIGLTKTGAKRSTLPIAEVVEEDDDDQP